MLCSSRLAGGVPQISVVALKLLAWPALLAASTAELSSCNPLAYLAGNPCFLLLCLSLSLFLRFRSEHLWLWEQWSLGWHGERTGCWLPFFPLSSPFAVPSFTLRLFRPTGMLPANHHHALHVMVFL